MHIFVYINDHLTSVHQNLILQKKLICHLIKSRHGRSLNSVTNQTANGVLHNIIHRLPRRSLLYKYHTVSRYTRKLTVLSSASTRKYGFPYADFHGIHKCRTDPLKLSFIQIGQQMCKVRTQIHLHSQVKYPFTVTNFTKLTILCADVFPDRKKNVENRTKFY
jgi:hypothetical protein